MIWTVPKIWEDGECWILGGGPSLPRQFGVPEETIQRVVARELPMNVYSEYMSDLHARHVIGVNSAFLIGPWIDMLFFGDKGWFLQNRKAVAAFPGLKITCHPLFRSGRYDGEHIKLVPRNGNRARGISRRPSGVSWNLNSGAAAISIAAHTGVRRIILLGFDMKLGDDGRQHFHGEYGTSKHKNREAKKLPFHRHILGFPEIAKDAKRMRIEIVNASPDSDLTCFKKRTVKELLNGEECG